MNARTPRASGKARGRTLPPFFLGVFGVLALTPSLFGALPEGDAPPALDVRHFPDRQHAFVWRNWNLVEPARLAKVLGTSEENVAALAASMGLPAAEPVSAHWRTRGYITIIRRNWHLLPYDQLLELLDWSPQKLEYTLREDDFLFVKLGNHKPRCARLTYAPPDEKASRRAAEIRTLVEREFGDELKKPAEPRFAFVGRFSRPVDRPRPVAKSDAPRFIYSYFAVYGDPLSDPSLDPYPDGLLQELADRGVNGVWLHTALRDLAPGGADFPEFGEGHERRLDNLRQLALRAKRFGMGVYLYVNEPRAMSADFFKARPDLAGVREGGYTAMCTSDPRVRRWISDSLAHVFSAVPGLAGVFTITASENLTSCASHFRQKDCPRCAERSGPEIIAEVNRAVDEGVHRGSAGAKVIAWDWGWPDDWAEPVINALPKSCRLQSVSEWSLPLERGGVRTTVGEYSLSAVGPGPRAARNWSLAKRAGLKTVAKVAFNNTWELSSVPWLPVTDLVAEHCEKLSSAGVDGMMLSWSLGGYPSPNLQVAQLIASGRSRDEALDAVATQRYGPAAAPHVRRAWALFSSAFREYPYDGSVVYYSPVQVGPANLLYSNPTGYAATMVGIPYDDLARWRGPYPPEVLAAQFEKVADGWDRGLAELGRAAGEAGGTAAREDYTLARAAGLHFRSVANQTRFLLARDGRRPNEQQRLAREEMLVAKELFTATRRDSRIGFEASNHYYYLPQDLIEKVINCQDVINRLSKP
jgi:hypothetical protein